MKNPELWVDASGRIGEFLDAEPDAAKIGAREWRSGGGTIRIFPIKRMEEGGDGPPPALIVLYGETDAGKAHRSLMDRLWALMDWLR
jgi:hypothetical protein